MSRGSVAKRNSSWGFRVDASVHVHDLERRWSEAPFWSARRSAVQQTVPSTGRPALVGTGDST